MCRRNGLRRKVTVLVNPGNIAQTEATLLEVRGADGLVVDPNYKGKGLQLQFTVEDDGVFTTPWSATVTRLSRDVGEYMCRRPERKPPHKGVRGCSFKPFPALVSRLRDR